MWVWLVKGCMYVCMYVRVYVNVRDSGWIRALLSCKMLDVGFVGESVDVCVYVYMYWVRCSVD